ncbi:MAG: hypothetical protein PF440_12065 [Thiomicrorhabdus sp.]|jgi:hypothetical protein|nr:hypothetical protein [Thiomicrorhabdus sp.]
MKRGDQIAYIPNHVKSKGLMHKDVEFGFVNSISPTDNETIFCRYWLKSDIGELRTVANSEATNIRDLIEYDSVSQSVVDDTITMIKKESERYGG